MSLFAKGSPHFQLHGSGNNSVIKLSNDNSYGNSIFGARWMPSDSNKVYTFKLECQNKVECFKEDGAGNIWFGFITERHAQNINADCTAKHSYLHFAAGPLFQNGKRVRSMLSSTLTYVTGDVCLYTLDFKKMEIRCRKNSEKEVVFFRKLSVGANTKYKLALGMFRVSESVTVSSMHDVEEKETEQRSTQNIIASMQQELKALKV